MLVASSAVLAGVAAWRLRGSRPSRDEIVARQYSDMSAARGYARTYDGWEPASRFFQSRLFAVDRWLRTVPGGELLDAGCGPGLLVRHLLATRPGDFRITAVDRSPAMLAAASEQAGGSPDVTLTLSRVEEMPYPDGRFDVAVAMGVLEYVPVEQTLREIARVVRPDGLVLVSMLNPLSLYRSFEWWLYRPALRLLRKAERAVGVPGSRAVEPAPTGIRTVPRRRLCRLLRSAGLSPEQVVYYDLTPLVPPLDKVVRRWSQGWRGHLESTVSVGRNRWMGTGYMVAARRVPTGR